MPPRLAAAAILAAASTALDLGLVADRYTTWEVKHLWVVLLTALALAAVLTTAYLHATSPPATKE